MKRIMLLFVWALFFAAQGCSCGDPVCGDGVLQKGEECDDGNFDNSDSCTTQCKIATCGDGFVRKNVEACDDGNKNNNDDCTNTCKLPTCGDGIVQTGEVCDDGNNSNTDACLNTCVKASCGDGFVQKNKEECDDANQDNNDACANSCKLAICGDGIVRRNLEACDDGNKDNSDGCTTKCARPTCGDGVVQKGEECDDGNKNDADECLSTCIKASCGDGIVQKGEECDDGNKNNTDACLSTCKKAKCGDGIVQKGVELCDDGDKDDKNGCTNSCTLSTCGDGIVQKGEECDDGNKNNTDGCLNTCVKASCGDGSVQKGEECDDGNKDNNDACLNTCKLAKCGDNVVRKGVEECDDGNTKDDDECSNQCKQARCGDGIVQKGEECDDGNKNNNDACLNTCVKARCGDGFVNKGKELCDDGNQNNDDKCNNQCTLPSCGDGVLQPGEACDDGNAENTDACLSTCVKATCGDGFLRLGIEECDDGNRRDTDACRNSCKKAVCGDGVVHAGVEACDDGNRIETDACRNSCKKAVCGDGVVHQDKEECDDTNKDNTDGCLVDCRKFDPCENFQISEVKPSVACVTSVPTQLTLVGTGFLRVNGNLPTALFQGRPVRVRSLNKCVALQGKFNAIDSCTEMVIDVPSGTGIGNYQIAIKNQVTKECKATANFSVGPAPTIQSVTPTELCEGRPGNFVIRGTGFTASTKVTFNNLTPASVRFVSTTQLNAGFAQLAPGRYSVTVSNGPGCSSTKSQVLVVYRNPIVFFVDPEVVYNKLRLQATAYLSGLNGGGISFVGLRDSNGATTKLSFNYSLTKPGIVKAIIPPGITAGEYSFVVRDNKTCENALPKAVKITSQLTMALSAVDPPFGWTQESTAVTLRTTSPLPSGKVAFQNGVRVYINASNNNQGLATLLNAVAYVSPREVTAVVPKLPVGDYDIIAVNPDGTTGVLQKGFKVTTDPPPVIQEITPGSIPNSQPQEVTVTGRGFASSGTIVATLSCRAPGGTVTSYTPSIQSRTTTKIVLKVAPGILTASVCVIRITNPDKTYSEYSALGITSPSLNISAFSQDTNMVTARRALAAESGRPTQTARFLYAIGGDGGNTSGALSSVEAASVNRFGDLGAWRTLPTKLPSGVTLGSAKRIGKFLYLVGGHTGSAPSRKVYRAKILEPATSPQITDVNITVRNSGGGVGTGLWYYRVSAVMPSSNDSNPNGETLPSDPQPIKLPSSLTKKVHIQLSWSAVPGASSYRVYRSPTPNLISGQEKLLVTLNSSTRTYTDQGGSTSSASARKIGDLGEWKEVSSLVKARAGHGLGIAKDPGSPNVWYLYALLGQTSGNSSLRSYEYLRVTVNSNGTHSVGSWVEDTSNLVSKARWQLAAFSVDQFATTRVSAGTTWIYAGPGLGALTAVDAGRVQSGGRLTSWQSVSTATPGYAGYGYAAAADQLFIFGGQGGAIGTSSKSTELCGGSTKCRKGQTIPQVKGWNAGISLRTARYLMGTAIESAHIYILGGTTNSGATKSVESTVW